MADSDSDACWQTGRPVLLTNPTQPSKTGHTCHEGGTMYGKTETLRLLLNGLYALSTLHKPSISLSPVSPILQKSKNARNFSC